MSFADKLKTRLIHIKQVAQEKVGEVVASEDLAETRLKTCLSCEHLFKPTNTCKKCGCFVNAKTKLTGQSCPLGKW